MNAPNPGQGHLAHPLFANVDLHCHSLASDGTLDPESLAERAHSAGVSLWALTDHDTLSGQDAARKAAFALGLAYLSGVEISISFCDETVHIVGLGFDEHNLDLRSKLDLLRLGRQQRAQEMSEQLAKAGIPDAYSGALAYANDPAQLSRAHFARYIVQIGKVRDVRSVFQKYLTPGKPGYVPHVWASLDEALSWIHTAGGVAVLAHPGRYRLNSGQERKLFEDFKALGGQAVEVVTGNHSREHVQKYASWASDYGLYASRGSDFHSPDESYIDLGKLPPLPASCRPVWALLEERGTLGLIS